MQHRYEAVQAVATRELLELAPRSADIVRGTAAVGAERQRPVAEAVARGLGVPVDIAAPGERGHHPLHDGRAQGQPAGYFSHADVGPLGLDDLEHVEAAFERLRSRG